MTVRKIDMLGMTAHEGGVRKLAFLPIERGGKVQHIQNRLLAFALAALALIDPKDHPTHHESPPKPAATTA